MPVKKGRHLSLWKREIGEGFKLFQPIDLSNFKLSYSLTKSLNPSLQRTYVSPFLHPLPACAILMDNLSPEGDPGWTGTNSSKRRKAILLRQKIAIIEQAYAFAEKAHDGQLRVSGEHYIEHPLQVAFILAELQLDAASLAAALLHDVPEDAKVPIAEIEAKFGAEIAKLVDGVTKLTKLSEQAAGAVPPTRPARPRSKTCARCLSRWPKTSASSS